MTQNDSTAAEEHNVSLVDILDRAERETHFVHVAIENDMLTRTWSTKCECGWDSGEYTKEPLALMRGIEHLNAIIKYELES